ncbi:unannotated protein [freshwater metagenome]|uniref:Unannotated protein n=1 Tax=freshwater metagenome TaxID=449393 RepID=A0A6J7LA58_9ZZZZ
MPAGQAAANHRAVPALVGGSPARLQPAEDPTVARVRVAGIGSVRAGTGRVRRSTVRVLMRLAGIDPLATAEGAPRRIGLVRVAVRIGLVRVEGIGEGSTGVGLHPQVTEIAKSIGRGWSVLETR